MRSGKPLILFSLLVSLLSFQASGQYNFNVDVTEGCTPLKARFTFVSTATTDSVATYYWSFGNGETSYDMNPDTVAFETEGIYDPTLVLVFSGGSELWITKPDLIVVHQSPQANFEYSTPSESYYYYLFEQNTIPDTATTFDFIWDIEDFASRTGPVQDITFPRADTFTVSLTITDDNGCSATMSKEIAVLQEITIPNVFTPGGDDSDNDLFLIRSAGDIPLRIQIYSRTGILVYETEGPVITWNGETASGDKLKSGIYFYLLEAISGDPQKLYSKTGFFHMYRKE